MATKAFLLIENQVGTTRQVVAALRGIEGVESVDIVTGLHDIILIIDGFDMVEIGNLVTGEIHSIPGIISTVTCVAVNQVTSRV